MIPFLVASVVVGGIQTPTLTKAQISIYTTLFDPHRSWPRGAVDFYGEVPMSDLKKLRYPKQTISDAAETTVSYWKSKYDTMNFNDFLLELSDQSAVQERRGVKSNQSWNATLIYFGELLADQRRTQNECRTSRAADFFQKLQRVNLGQARTLAPDWEDTLKLLCLGTRDSDTQREYASELAKTHPDSYYFVEAFANTLRLAAKGHLVPGDNDKRIAMYKRLGKQFPDQATPYFRLSSVLLGTKDGVRYAQEYLSREQRPWKKVWKIGIAELYSIR
jgi:hypothetical protein